MKIAFHSSQLGLRGTEVALYSYAKYNEDILGNESIIISQGPSQNRNSHPLVLKKFRNRFETIYLYKDFSEVESFLDKENVDVFYVIKSGENDGIVSKGRKTVIHAVFQAQDPHGDVYAYVSEWLGKKFDKPFVPHMVDLPNNVEGDLKKELNIPSDAIVFGSYGGQDSFNIEYVHRAIKKILNERDDVYFIFMNIDVFVVEAENAIFLEGIGDLESKVKFINTCDAMIHARHRGESFGLAIAEFSSKNKPIITTRGGPRWGEDNAHIEMLGSKGIIYNNEDEVYDILNTFVPDVDKDWNAYKEYTPEKVMNKFEEVFLK